MVAPLPRPSAAESSAKQTLGPATRPHEYLCLDGLRGLAAIGVVLAHAEAFFGAWASPSGHYDRGVLAWRMYNALAHGQFFVCIFFVLSGFVLLVKYDRTGDARLLREGAVKRYVRLTPVVLFSTVFAWLTYKTIGFRQTAAAELIGGHRWLSEIYGFPLVLRTAMYQGLWGAYRGEDSYNSVLWTISIELWGSLLLFGFVSLFYRSRTYVPLAVLAMLVLVVIGGDSGVYYSLFLGGSVLLKSRARVPIALLPLVLFIGVQNPHTPFVKWCRTLLDQQSIAMAATPSVLCTGVAALLIVGMVLGNERLTATFSLPLFVWLGKISFSLYAIHLPLIPSIGCWIIVHGQSWMSARMLGFSAFAGVIAAALVLADVVTRVLEIPSREWANRFGAACTRYTMSPEGP